MTAEEIRERLLLLREMDFAGAEKLAEDIAKDAREPLSSFARVLQWPHYQDRGKIESVLKLLGELSILPWLSASRKLDGAARTQALSESHRVYEELEQQIIEKLRGMLAGQTPVPPPRGLGPVDVRIPVTRECDEAYLLLRHLHKPNEAEGDFRRNRLKFARMSQEERDNLIHHYVDTREFK